MAPSDFVNANLDEIVEQLTIDEAIQLIAGVGLWHTHSVDRLGIPAIKVCLSTSELESDERLSSICRLAMDLTGFAVIISS